MAGGVDQVDQERVGLLDLLLDVRLVLVAQGVVQRNSPVQRNFILGLETPRDIRHFSSCCWTGDLQIRKISHAQSLKLWFYTTHLIVQLFLFAFWQALNFKMEEAF